MTTLPPSRKRAQFSIGGAYEPPFSERALPRQRAADDELVNALRTFIRDDGLEIQHVPHRAVIEGDSRSTQHVAAVTRNVERGANVAPLCERHLGIHRSAVLFELREPPRDQLRAGQLADGVGEPRLD